MKKKLFLIGGLITLCGFAFSSPRFVSVKAEEEIVEQEPIAEEEIEQEENEGVFSSISQWAKDTIEVIKEVCSEPIVIGGVSVTLGTILLWVVSKIVGSVGSKKIKARLLELEEKAQAIDKDIKEQDYNKLVADNKALYELCKLIVPTLKNVKVRENCEKLLKDLEPVVEDTKVFAKEEIKQVVDDTKAFAESEKSEILEILDRD